MTDEHWRKRYRRHIRSPQWRALKQRLLRERGMRCQRCGTPADQLVLHHTTYERLGKERDEDLMLVCRPCHPGADLQRELSGRARRLQRSFRGAPQPDLF